MKIKKLKNDKKSLNDKLEKLQSEVLKSSIVSFQVEDKGINIHPVNITSKEEEESTEVKS